MKERIKLLAALFFGTAVYVVASASGASKLMIGTLTAMALAIAVICVSLKMAKTRH